MWKQHKFLIIGVIALIVVTILIAIFGDKLFGKKKSNEVDNTNENNNNLSTNNESIYINSLPNELEINAKKVGDKAYSNARQQIARVEIVKGRYSATGSTGTINKDSLIGIVEKRTPNGYYVKAAPGLKASYYYVGTSQVK